MGSRMNVIAPSLTIAIASAAIAQDCPPEQFDWGPPRDALIARIVLDHYGPAGPLLPVPEDYDRAARDVYLLRAAIPALAGVGQDDGWVRDEIIIGADPPLTRDVECANLFFQAHVEPVYPGAPYWIVSFPELINPWAMCETYMLLPGVNGAGENAYGCMNCPPCSSSWQYNPRSDGTWRWTMIACGWYFF